MRLIDADALQVEYKKRHEGKRLLLIDVAPTIESERKTGHWIERDSNGVWQCDQCRKYCLIYKAHYCPNCGAKMEGNG